MDVPTDRPSPAVGPSLPTSVADAGAKLEQLAGLIPPVAAGRGVLDGAFAVLGALARADDGLGLTALARASGLAKTSAHRLAEQLITLGAVQCVEHRYYIGPQMFRIGQRWQPDPLLRRFAQAPVHTLAINRAPSRRCGSCMRIASDTSAPLCPRPRLLARPADPQSIARTATGRVLYAIQPVGHVTLPDCWTRREWRNLRESVANRAQQWSTIKTPLSACVVFRARGWPKGACAARSLSRSRQTTYPLACPPVCRPLRLAWASPFSN